MEFILEVLVTNGIPSEKLNPIREVKASLFPTSPKSPVADSEQWLSAQKKNKQTQQGPIHVNSDVTGLRRGLGNRIFFFF